MTQEQPATDSVQPQAPQAPVDPVRAAAQALAQKRWASRQPQEPVEANPPAAKPKPTPAEKPTAPETEEPASESDLEQGQDDGEEAEVVEEATEAEGEESEGEEPEEQPGHVSLDDLDPDDAIIVDGKETTVREIRESRLRMDDYTRKTQALAQQREVLAEREKLVAFSLGQQEQELVNGLQQMQQIDWQAMSVRDPNGFQNAKAQMEGMKMRLEQVRQEQRGFLQQIKQYEESIAKAQAKAAQKELKEKVPGWNNALYYSLVDYAETIGFQRGDVLKYTDPNIFLMLQKAKAYDEAKRITTKKTVKASPKRTQRAAQPASPESKTNRKLEEVQRHAQQAGTMDAAMELLRAKRGVRARG